MGMDRDFSPVRSAGLSATQTPSCQLCWVQGKCTPTNKITIAWGCSASRGVAAAPVPAEPSEVLTAHTGLGTHCLPSLEPLHHSKVAGTRLKLILTVDLPRWGNEERKPQHAVDPNCICSAGSEMSVKQIRHCLYCSAVAIYYFTGKLSRKGILPRRDHYASTGNQQYFWTTPWAHYLFLHCGKTRRARASQFVFVVAIAAVEGMETAQDPAGTSEPVHALELWQFTPEKSMIQWEKK